MKLIEQKTLFFQEGNSDKIYEVDLCEVGPQEYLVNFRYGRRGATLKEGTKTVFPVPIDEAHKIFEKLVTSKEKKGYAESLPTENTPSTPLPQASPDSDDPRKDQILLYLEAAANQTYDEKRWALSRLVWRAGELRLQEAEKHLVKFQFNENEIFNYSLIWALGRCGGPASLLHIHELIAASASEPVQTLSKFAIALLGSEEDKKRLVYQHLENLPQQFQQLYKNKNTTEFENELIKYSLHKKAKDTVFFIDIYLIGLIEDWLLPALRECLKVIQLKAPHFKAIRTIFKCAAFTSDYITYGCLARRFESDTHAYSTSYWSSSVYVDREWIDAEKEKKKKKPKLAYSKQTREYFIRRIQRDIQRQGEAKTSEFTKLATGYLLGYTNADSKGPAEDTQWYWDRSVRSYEKRTTHYPEYAEYITFSTLLYQNSTRLEQPYASARWRFKQDQDHEIVVSEQREEAYPALWDEDCPSLLLLLQESECDPVINFAAKAFQENPAREKHYTSSLAHHLLLHQVTLCNQLGLEIAKQLIEQEDDKSILILAALNSPLQEARNIGIEWLNKHVASLTTSAAFIATLLCLPQPEVHQWIDQQLTLSTTEAEAIAPLVLASIQKLADDNTVSKEGFQLISSSVTNKLAEALRNTDFNIIEALLTHPMGSMRSFAVQLLLLNQDGIARIPEDIFAQLIQDEEAEVRQLGVSLFGKLPLPVLITKKDIILSFVLSAHTEVRQEATPIIQNLVTHDAAFGRAITQLFIPLFLEKEKYEGLHQDVLQLFKSTLKTAIFDYPMEQTWDLLSAYETAAVELFAFILVEKNNAHALSVKEWVKLGSAELLSLREICWKCFDTQIDKIKDNPEAAIKLLDATWTDTREFAQHYFKTHFIAEDWTPELLISICDSVRTETQDYGKKRILHFFEEKDRDHYLLKLSEHPNTHLQLFVSNYVHRYAEKDLAKLKQLEYFFSSALNQINRGKTVKLRLFEFLRQQALADVAIAEWVLPLITRLSLTIALRDKATCLRILLDIQQKYPQLNTPLTIEEPELK